MGILLALSFGVQAQTNEQRILFLVHEQGLPVLYTMRPDGTDVQPFASPVFEEGGQLTSASLSPNGLLLAVSSRKDRIGHPTDEIFIWNLDDGTVSALTDDGGNNTLPVWSPDSRYVAYLSGSGINGYSQVTIADTLTHEKHPLITSSDLRGVVYDESTIRGVDWSPDGEMLVLSAQTGLPDARNLLVTVARDGTDARQITPDSASVGPVVIWGNSPDTIYVDCYLNDHGDICQVDPETAEITPITDTGSIAASTQNPFLSYMAISNDDQIIFQYGVVNPTSFTIDIATGNLTLLSDDIDPITIVGWTSSTAPPITPTPRTN